MRPGRLAALAVLAGLGAAATHAAELDVAVGEGLARRNCSACHKLGAAATHAQPPSFYDLAQDPALTEAKLQDVLSHQHHGMPNQRLTTDDRAALAGYIMSLRQQAK